MLTGGDIVIHRFPLETEYAPEIGTAAAAIVKLIIDLEG
jgi:hypothetical protein